MNQIDAMFELARFQRLRERVEEKEKEYKERNHGRTSESKKYLAESIKYLADHIHLLGMIVCVEGRRCMDWGDTIQKKKEIILLPFQIGMVIKLCVGVLHGDIMEKDQVVYKKLYYNFSGIIPLWILQIFPTPLKSLGKNFMYIKDLGRGV